ncbi:MAG: butyrate kinase [Bacteroidales bacterium]|jgi:butyrate kinase|nr:butyrate kinase [Bacteroidales bacterium]
MILVINPGSTSTKIAVYNKDEVVFQETIRHSAEEIGRYPTIADQLPFRKKIIMEELEKSGINLSQLQVIIGRGGLIKPVKSGIYRINDAMKKDMVPGFQGQHASNLGGLIADEIAKECPQKVDAYIADPVVVDELQPCARIAGHPLFERRSVFHALNQKSIARIYAQSVHRSYQEMNLIIAHLGGGVSVAAHYQGSVIDVNQALDGEGPFSPERSGTLPTKQLVDLCFSGQYTHREVSGMLNGKGGMVAYCQSNNVQDLVDKAQSGDEYTRLILDAFCYQVAKDIGAMSVVLKGKTDQIILTGGIAFNHWITDQITAYVSFIAPITIYPGEDEMAALAMNAQLVISGELIPGEYF